MSFWGKLFGTDTAIEKTIDTVSAGLDKLYYSDEEKADDAKADRSEARLGECINGEYVFDDSGKQAVYESIYDTTPKLVNVDGDVVEVSPPYMIGVFA